MCTYPISPNVNSKRYSSSTRGESESDNVAILENLVRMILQTYTPQNILQNELQRREAPDQTDTRFIAT